MKKRNMFFSLSVALVTVSIGCVTPQHSIEGAMENGSVTSSRAGGGGMSCDPNSGKGEAEKVDGHLVLNQLNKYPKVAAAGGEGTDRYPAETVCAPNFADSSMDSRSGGNL